MVEVKGAKGAVVATQDTGSARLANQDLLDPAPAGSHMTGATAEASPASFGAATEGCDPMTRALACRFGGRHRILEGSLYQPTPSSARCHKVVPAEPVLD